MVTGAGSKAYAALHGPATATGSALRRLEDLGVEFVGKEKTSMYVLVGILSIPQKPNEQVCAR